MRQLAGSWNAGDLEATMERFDPAVEFSPDPRWPEPGPYHGRETVARFMDGYRSAWGQVELEIHELGERRGMVVAQCRWIVQGASSGADVPVAFTLVVRFGPSGLVDRMRAFFDHDEALEWVESAASGPGEP
jgi:hypothetical protein